MRGVLAAALLALLATADSQARQPPPPTYFTGTWVSVVTEDWKWRMLTPAKGDILGIPVNPQARKIAESWDYAKDIAAGNECKAYGAAHVLRLPTRVRISWQDERTLKMETDAGRQTRLLHFDRNRPPSGARTLQGHSTAEWVDGAALKVVTTNLADGYLRKNGVPHSRNAVVTEYFDRFPVPGAGDWFVVKTIVEDPAYLTGPYIVSSNFMREPDESKWRPSACEVDPPLVPTKADVR
jgi:hypothetical protein